MNNTPRNHRLTYKHVLILLAALITLPITLLIQTIWMKLYAVYFIIGELLFFRNLAAYDIATGKIFHALALPFMIWREALRDLCAETFHTTV